jgi:uncharacterized protein with PQ loop repeat
VKIAKIVFKISLLIAFFVFFYAIGDLYAVLAAGKNGLPVVKMLNAAEKPQKLRGASRRSVDMDVILSSPYAREPDPKAARMYERRRQGYVRPVWVRPIMLFGALHVLSILGFLLFFCFFKFFMMIRSKIAVFLSKNRDKVTMPKNIVFVLCVVILLIYSVFLNIKIYGFQKKISKQSNRLDDLEYNMEDNAERLQRTIEDEISNVESRISDLED